MKKITKPLVQTVIDLTDRMTKGRKTKISIGGGGITRKDIESVLDDPRRQELVDTLFALRRSARTELVALMLLGRGDFKDLKSAVSHCSEYKEASGQVIYILGKTANLSQYLRDGLKKAAN